MKNLVLIAALVLTSKSALAMHAYATDSCVAKSPNGPTVAIELGNDTPSSPHRLNIEGSGITDAKPDEDFWVNEDQSANSVDMSVKDSDLVLKVKSDIKTSGHKIDDGCFQGDAQTSIRTVMILKVSKRLATSLEMKKGDTLVFSCYTDGQAPTGSHCGQ